MIALVVSQFNADITHGLLRGALEYCKEKGISVHPDHIFYVPGAFEIPLIAQKLARTGKFKGVVGLGCVIQGETAHFEFISLGATLGTLQAMLQTEVPISFGIITTYSEQDAFIRSADDTNNKGREAAAACLSTIEILKNIEAIR